jgi:hypothetical protein
MSNLGNILKNLNKLEEAENIQSKCLDIRKKILPKNHPDICSSMNNLGGILI